MRVCVWRAEQCVGRWCVCALSNVAFVALLFWDWELSCAGV